MFIPNDLFQSFINGLAKLNEKLAKYGSAVEILEVKNFTAPFVLHENELLMTSSVVEKNGCFYVEGKQVELSLPEIKGKQNVKYLGTIDASQGTLQVHGNIENLHEKVSLELIDTCYHCNVTRARVKYFFFEEDGQIRKIGSTCVKEWFGLDIESILSAYEKFTKEIEEEIENLGMPKSYNVDLGEVVDALSHVTKNFQIDWEKGYTVQKMWQVYGSKEIEKVPSLQPIIEKWANIIPTNDFQFNILSALFNEDKELRKRISNNVIAVACWAINNAFYSCNKEKKENAVNSYIGNVGDKIQFTAVPKLVSSWETAYGITRLYSFETAQGNVKWFSTSVILDTEKEITMKGTVKEQSEYNGFKQTVVTRCKQV